MRSHFHVHPPGSDTPIVFLHDTGVAQGMSFINLWEAGSNALSMVQTLCQQYEGFTNREVLDVRHARDTMAMVGHPLTKEFDKIVSAYNNLRNLNVKPTHTNHTKFIFGPPITGIRGKTIHVRPVHVETNSIRILREFYILHPSITLTADVMFVNGLPMLVTSS